MRYICSVSIYRNCARTNSILPAVGLFGDPPPKHAAQICAGLVPVEKGVPPPPIQLHTTNRVSFSVGAARSEHARASGRNPALHSCSALLLCNPALFFSLCRSLTSSPSGARLMAPHAQVSTARRARALGCAPPANPQHAVEPPSELPRGDSKRDFNTRRADRAFWLLSAGDR